MRASFNQIALTQIYILTRSSPYYYTELARRLPLVFDKPLMKVFDEKIDKILTWLSDENEPKMTILELEMILWSNYNLKSFFEFNGEEITKFDIIKELDKVDKWVANELSIIHRNTRWVIEGRGIS